jgi:outer membrane receptor protein involved in Fe transport
LSSTTGKIAGIVTDAETEEPLQGATINVEGTQIFAEADSDGEFYIINLPVGEHSITVTTVGYETVTVREIRVLMDLTTPLELALQPGTIDLDKAVTVVAKRPLIQRDKTSSGETVTRDEIAYVANTQNIQSIISNMAGTVVDGDGGLHVRGGRDGSVKYYYDGFSVQDPFGDGIGIRISPDVVEELSLTSGGLAPEYGEALSGVVNAITREGSNQFLGRLKYYEAATHGYNVDNGSFGGLTRTENRSVLLDLSGPLFEIGDRPVTFYSNGEYIRDDGYLPHNRSKIYSTSTKIVTFPTPKTKLVLNGSYYFRDTQRYTHRDNNNISYDFNLDGLGKIENESYLVGIKSSYNKSQNTVITLRANRFRNKTKVAPEHLFDLYWDQWPGYSVDIDGIYNGTIDDSNYQRSPDYSYIGFTSGNDYRPYYLESFSAYNGAGISYLSQFDKNNQIKMGGDIRSYLLTWDNRQFYNTRPYGETYKAQPWIGAAYAQDKIELNDMVINIGLRFDYLYSDIEYWHDPIDKDYRVKSKPKVQWSPRLGISHPVSVSSVLHFNYGYLFQPPNVRLMYTNLQGELGSGYPLIGNPDLDAEKTVYYELGWTKLLGDNLRMGVTTYYRDVKNMIGAREVVDDDGNIYTVFTNSDYGSVKGFDLILESIDQHLINWSANYSYMQANGNASDPYEWYYDYYTVDSEDRPPVPAREYPLAFDQRHKLTAIVDFRVARGERLKVLGRSLPDAWGINLLARYASGLAYTRTDKNGRRIGPLNGERMPYTLRFDMRFNKDLYMLNSKNSFVSLFVEVENLFDRRNVVDVYTQTGQPDNDGQLALNVNSPTYEQEKLWYELLAKDPQNFDHPRLIRVGIEFKF